MTDMVTKEQMHGPPAPQPRNIFFEEIGPSTWISINAAGPLTLDSIAAAKAYLDRHEARLLTTREQTNG